ncbi:hypothetical protein EDD86DRAFT_244148 [Gorgonomyces haynaldii]|nr:hypothetical protein EDD86DRAFT_244148 [Gorgonomyces haynaldii]
MHRTLLRKRAVRPQYVKEKLHTQQHSSLSLKLHQLLQQSLVIIQATHQAKNDRDIVYSAILAGLSRRSVKLPHLALDVFKRIQTLSPQMAANFVLASPVGTSEWHKRAFQVLMGRKTRASQEIGLRFVQFAGKTMPTHKIVDQLFDWNVLHHGSVQMALLSLSDRDLLNGLRLASQLEDAGVHLSVEVMNAITKLYCDQSLPVAALQFWKNNATQNHKLQSRMLNQLVRTLGRSKLPVYERVLQRDTLLELFDLKLISQPQLMISCMEACKRLDDHLALLEIEKLLDNNAPVELKFRLLQALSELSRTEEALCLWQSDVRLQTDRGQELLLQSFDPKDTEIAKRVWSAILEKSYSLDDILGSLEENLESHAD